MRIIILITQLILIKSLINYKDNFRELFYLETNKSNKIHENILFENERLNNDKHRKIKSAIFIFVSDDNWLLEHKQG